MTNDEIKRVFCEKIKENYLSFYRDWTSITPEELIEDAAFVQATKVVFNYYKDGCADVDAMRYLIGFENPLEILRDGIVCDMDGDVNSIVHSRWELCDRRDADEIYEKDIRYFTDSGSGGSPGSRKA